MVRFYTNLTQIWCLDCEMGSMKPISRDTHLEMIPIDKKKVRHMQTLDQNIYHKSMRSQKLLAISHLYY